MMMKLNTVGLIGASTAAVFALTGCGDDDEPKLGSSCNPSNDNDCGDGDLVCQTFDNESYCTLPCTGGDLGACEEGESGSSGQFECDAAEGESGFCKRTESPPPSGSILGQSCNPSDDGVCGQGTEEGSDYECEQNPETQEYFCTLPCDGQALGECLSTANPPSGYTCNEDAGFCVPDGPAQQFTLGQDCDSSLLGACGSTANPSSGLVCKNDPNQNKEICTQSCDPDAVGTCGQGTQGGSDYTCVGANKDSAFCFLKTQEPDYSLGSDCTIGDMGSCGTTANPPSGLFCKSDIREFGQGICTEECDTSALGACNDSIDGATLECRSASWFGNKGYCFPK